MRRLWHPEEVRELDRRAIHELGLPGIALMECAGAEAARAVRERGTLHSIVVLDVDSFREYNRKHGRAHADRLLTSLAAMISRECRDGDALVRSGADEFALVLPGSAVEAGTATARRVVSAIADWGHEDGVTVSAGVACMISHGASDVLTGAMEALAEAKAAGSGRIAIN